MEADTTDPVIRARAVVHDVFRDLVEGHPRESEVHCHRILGSV